MSIPITVIIAVRNEVKNLPACLLSIEDMDQVIVVDSHSTDGTERVATSMGAEVTQFTYDGGWPKKRNWALRNLSIRNEWVLVLDADERLDDELRREIVEAIGSAAHDGYYLRWKFYFLGRWMKHCWRHGWMLRLFKHGKAEYEDLGLRLEGGWDAEVHENIVLKSGHAASLKNWLIHDSKEDLTYWIGKQNEFSTWNAKRRERQLGESMPKITELFSSDPLRRRKYLKTIFIRLPFRSLGMFLWLYIFNFGFLDGKAGYYFCRLRANHEFNINAKNFELKLHKNSAD